MSIFPFTDKAYDNGHFVSNPDARKSFLKSKPEDLSWYCFDVEVLSRESAVFTVYTLACSVYGGIGPKIAEFSGPLLEVEADKLIEQELRREARYQEAVEYEEKRSKRRKEILEELRKEVYNTGE